MPDLRAITLWQPWASLIADGYKKVETRSWPTNHRGPLAIHAARKSAAEGIDALGLSLPYMHPALQRLYDQPIPLGAVVAIANVSDCYRMDADTLAKTDPVERALGDHRPDRYGWVIDRVHRLSHPVACLGAQGIWNLPDDVVRQIAAMEGLEWAETT